MSVPPSAGSSSDRTYHRDPFPRKVIATGLALAAAGGWWAARRRPFRVAIEGESMRPSLEPGEWAVAVRHPRIQRGDVVVLDHPSRPGFDLVKRVLAIPGDLGPDGRELGPDELWVEGDAPGASTDSRSFGPVRLEQVKGTVVFVYWPPDRRRRMWRGPSSSGGLRSR